MRDTGAKRVCYRYRTAALAGPWRRSPEAAHGDAAGAGQVAMQDEAQWRVPGGIEASHCDEGGPCGGRYPPEDPVAEDRSLP